MLRASEKVQKLDYCGAALVGKGNTKIWIYQLSW